MNPDTIQNEMEKYLRSIDGLEFDENGVSSVYSLGEEND